MPIPWLVVLQSVPWTDVIRNAPKVADGAKKLWNTVAGKPTQPQVPKAASIPNGSTEAQAIAGLEARVVSLEAFVSELHSQMLASSELIKALAEQNGQLVARVEANRVRTLWLSSALAFAAVVAVVSLVLVLRHGA
jgi:hypothetical protein